ncbi:cutinase family protein [Phycicoccus sp. CSK15P-2]|uniref:cutinase family protein n=1 Tax=Phycicoccus sp. CSK15P-2 TaxID=2807627 RepID=UPI001950B19D|nr:cutinase family protein [Phycicoccus sp. CSK15P-2]MBM6406090.1 cutinase family protein [Phycicoccus sp. CSK15P-2]
MTFSHIAARFTPRAVAAALATGVACSAFALVSPGAGLPSAAAADCSDVDIVFARGTGELPGLGFVGRPFASELTSRLSGYSVSTYAVDYAANSSQTSAGPGATDMSNHIREVASACPSTRFVIGGYSQGATVTDIAVGIRTGSSSGQPIAAQDEPRVAAVVVFGNPLGLQRRTIAEASPTYGDRSKDYCGTADSVCGRYQANVSGGHTSYPSNGATDQGAAFAANLVRSSAPTPTPTPTGTSTPTPTPTPTPDECVTDSTADHVDAGRATSFFGRAYAVGSRDSLGFVSRFVVVSLQRTDATTWERVATC